MTDKKKSNIVNDITLLLTIYNRRKYSLRWIKFIQDFNCPFKIYICDGGNDKILQKKLENISKKNNRIIYKKYTYFKNFKKFHEKFYLATKDIKTKYTYLCEDDDFLIFKNIIKSGIFLNKNKDYTCSGGQSFNLEILNNYFYLGRSEHIYKNISYKQNLKSTRLINLLNNMQSNWNCLHRTIDLCMTFKLINNIDFNNYIESELLFILSSFYSGKINRFDHIEYIKVDNTSFSSSENFSKKNNYLKIISSKTYSFENYAFIELFKKKFPKQELQIIENI